MKTILLTALATTTTITIAIALASTLFLNTILGAFGLVSTSIGTFQDLKRSQQVVNKMQQRHRQKKANVSKKLAKKSAVRVASTTLAAATVGTVAVAVTMASLEVADYCEEKEELQNEENILFSTDIEFDMNQCFEEGKEDTKTILYDSMNSSVKAVSNAFDNTVEYSAETWSAIKEASLEAFQSTGDAAGELWDATYSWIMQ